MRQSSKNNSEVSEQRLPTFFSFLPTEKPGVRVGNRTRETPRRPGSPVRTASTMKSAREPLVIQSFCPEMTNSSPSARAVVRRAATSEPPPGSLMPSAPIHSPAMAGRMKTSLCSAVPSSLMMGMVSSPCTMRPMPVPGLSAHAMDSMAAAVAHQSRPLPPSSVAMRIPNRPRSAALRKISRGKMPASSHSWAKGAISSGSPANLAVYLAFLHPGDTVMGMALPMGGHLTHGWPVSVTGKWFRAVQYGVRADTGRVDLDEVRDLARRERPKVIFCGGTAIPRIIDFAAFGEIAAEVDAILVADIAHISGLIAGGAHPSPVGHAGVITTTTHKTLRAPRGAMIMCTAEHAKAIDKAVFPGLQGGPHNHTTAAIAVALKEAATPEFASYAHQVVAKAQALAAALLDRGFSLVSGGSDNHLILIDLTPQGIGGKPGARALDRAGIEVNYNTVPFDTRKPFDPSGIRIGTPSITTRGLTEQHMPQVAAWMAEAITAAIKDDEPAIERIAGQVRDLLDAFPMPGWAPQR